MAKIKKIIFLVIYPLNARDYARYGVDILQQNGFEVVFFSLSDIINPLIRKKSTIPDLMEKQKCYCFRNKNELIRAIIDLPKESFVIVNIVYSHLSFYVYQALSMAGILYAVNITNAIPMGERQPVRTYYIKTLLHRISHFSFPKLKRHIQNIVLRPKFYKHLGIMPPRFLLAGGLDSLCMAHMYYPIGPNTEIVWLHTLDYDIYLKTKDFQSQGVSYNKALFLDVGAPEFPGDDVVLENRRPVLSKERYYPSLCKFFNVVERTHGVKIEIAAHPRSNHSECPDYFGNRFTIRGKTLEMMKGARFVIAHASTAVNFAVLLKKPIIFITSDEYEASQYGDAEDLKAMASCFAKVPINIDGDEPPDWEREMFVDKTLYDNYRQRFIKKDGAEEAISWQIVANRLRCL